MDQDSIAKHTKLPPGKAIVFIIRPGGNAFAVSMRLDCDSFQVGWITANTYLYTILDSGEHIFKARSENEFHLKVHLESGKTYYLAQIAKMGILYARTKLYMLNEMEGYNLLSRYIISKHNRYPDFPNSKDVERSPPKENH